MATKLTLTVEKSIIERAKFYAKNAGKSLSEIIQNHLEFITREKNDKKLSNKLDKIVGSVKLPHNFNQDKELLSYFENKHL